MTNALGSAQLVLHLTNVGPDFLHFARVDLGAKEKDGGSSIYDSLHS